MNEALVDKAWPKLRVGKCLLGKFVFLVAGTFVFCDDLSQSTLQADSLLISFFSTGASKDELW